MSQFLVLRKTYRAPADKLDIGDIIVGKCAYCGAKTNSPYGICSECEAKTIEQYEADVRGYFVCCPLCGSEQIKTHFIMGGRDTLSCESCGAKWHLYVGLTGFKWAELDLESGDKRGMHLLGKRLDKEEWKKMAHDARRTMPREVLTKKRPSREGEDTKGAREREIIREKEVIVKVRCPYCRNLFDETLDKCPHCGAKR